MVTAMQIPHKSMFDHVCMFSLANRHLIVRSLKLPRFLVSLFYSCSDYINILTLIQFNSATLFFSLSLSLSLPVSPSVKTAVWGVASPFMPQKNTIDYREIYIYSKKWFRPSSDFLPAASMSTTRDATSKVSKIPRSFPSDLDGVLCHMWCLSNVKWFRPLVIQHNHKILTYLKMA